MRKLFLNKKKDIGAIGIGAMIVLIAMILVAGVAASVLISTSNILQTQAMKTASQTLAEVSGGIHVYSVYGLINYTQAVNSSSKIYDKLWCLAITVETRPGSNSIDLNNTYILFSNGKTKSVLSYNYTSLEYYNSKLEGDIFDYNSTSGTSVNWSNLTADKFAIGVLQDYDLSMANSYYPAMNRGDKAVLYVYIDTSAVFGERLDTRTEVFGQVVPEFGAPGVISFTTPKAYAADVYQLQ